MRSAGPRSSAASRGALVHEGLLEAVEPLALLVDEGMRLGVDVVEDDHRVERVGVLDELAGARAELLRLRGHLVAEVLWQLAQALEVGLEPGDGVTLAPVVLLERQAVARRVVG